MTELDLTAENWFNIAGRGWVAAIENGYDLPKGMSAKELVNRYVKIDGLEYWVKAVETFTTSTYNSTQGFGLLIRGDK